MFLGSFLAGLLQDIANILLSLSVVSVIHAICVSVVIIGVMDNALNIDILCKIKKHEQDGYDNYDNNQHNIILQKCFCSKTSNESDVEPFILSSEPSEIESSAFTSLSGENEHATKSERSVKNIEHGLFSWGGLQNSVMAVLRKRQANRRLIIILCLAALTVNHCIKVGVYRYILT